MSNDKLSQLALLSQMVESAEKSIQSAKHLLRELLGVGVARDEHLAEKASVLNMSASGRVIEGVFDGQNMVGSDGKTYPVPANYASKSKLVEGDVLKLTIGDDGSFIYKQIGPVLRKRVLGLLTETPDGEYRVIAEGKPYKVLLASLTYFRASLGDEITLLLPKDGEATFGGVEHVLKHGEQGSAAIMPRSAISEDDMDADLVPESPETHKDEDLESL